MKQIQWVLVAVGFVGVTFLAITKGYSQESSHSGTGTIAGKVTLSGAIPEMPLLKREQDPFCAKTPMKDEEVVVNQNGTLKNVAVRIVKGASAVITAPAEPVMIDQQDCMYRPRVIGVVNGQKVMIRSSDPVLHNVHSYFGTITGFNRAQFQGLDFEETFPAGITQLKCDVHPWMTAWVVANDNPFIAVTSDSGEFTLSAVPAGTYTLEAWHEKYGTKTVDVTVSSGQTTDVNFDFAS